MIEVLIPGQSNQEYPEAVLRSLVDEGKVQPDWKARMTGTSNWDSVSVLLNPRSNVSGTKVQHVSHKGSSSASYPNENRIAERYAHGQALVKALDGNAENLEALGVLAAIVIPIASGFGGSFLTGSNGAIIVLAVVGLILGLLIRSYFKTKATLIRIQASLLAANIDTAIYTCPYLSDAARLALILPKA